MARVLQQALRIYEGRGTVGIGKRTKQGWDLSRWSRCTVLVDLLETLVELLRQ